MTSLIQKLPPRARLAVVLPLVMVLLGMAGCLSDGQRESLQTHITQLAGENKLLSEQVKRLEADRAGVSNDLLRVSRELADLTEHAERLRQLNAALQEDARALRGAYESLREEHTRLLLKELELRRKPHDPRHALQPKPTTQESKTEAAEVSGREDIPDASITPCEAMIHFLQKSEAAIRQYKGYERLQKIRVIRAQFFQLIEKAPREVREAAESWLEDLIRVQADPSDPSMNPFLSKRHRLLKACIKEQ